MELKKIGIIGYGTIGEHIEFFINQKYNNETAVYYFDDQLSKKQLKKAYPLKDFDNTEFADFEFYIGMGYKNSGFKKEIIDQLNKNKFKFPPFIHPSSNINRTATVGNGTIIYPMCTVGFQVQIGEGSVIHNSCTLSHDSKVGTCVFLSPAVVISGNVTIGDGTFAGSASVIANNLTIGRNVKIGIGTVLQKNITDNSFVIGNPAKIVSGLNIY
jgi:sugar O-acyltransferase (sialic acid O-acetyltransferase NeuD family)